jgi:hypothetical protein
MESNELLNDSAADLFFTKDGKVVTMIDDLSVDGRGELKECVGLNNNCFVINDYFKFMLPKSFSFEMSEVWQWEDFKYESTATREIGILGAKYRVTEVIGFSAKGQDKVVKMYEHPTLGLLYFSISLENYSSTYILHSSKGLWAKP